MIRYDGRNTNQLRPYSMEYGFIGENYVTGSCRWQQGSEILVTISGPNQPKYSRQERFDRMNIDINLSMTLYTNRSSEVRSMETFLTEELLKVINIENYPRMLLFIKIHVVKNDGSVYASTYNACILALIDSGISMKSTPIATSLSYSLLDDNNFTLLLDPTKQEEKDSDSNILFITSLHSGHSNENRNKDMDKDVDIDKDRNTNADILVSSLIIGKGIHSKHVSTAFTLAQNCSQNLRQFIRNLFHQVEE